MSPLLRNDRYYTQSETSHRLTDCYIRNWQKRILAPQYGVRTWRNKVHTLVGKVQSGRHPKQRKQGPHNCNRTTLPVKSERPCNIIKYIGSKHPISSLPYFQSLFTAGKGLHLNSVARKIRLQVFMLAVWHTGSAVYALPAVEVRLHPLQLIVDLLSFCGGS